MCLYHSTFVILWLPLVEYICELHNLVQKLKNITKILQYYKINVNVALKDDK